MRRVTLLALASAAVLLAGCDKNPTGFLKSPPVSPGYVAFVPSKAEYRQDEDITATLANHSVLTLYVYRSCPPVDLQLEINGGWEPFVPQWVIVCPLTFDIPAPIAVPPGAEIPFTLLRNNYHDDLSPASYRFVVYEAKGGVNSPIHSEPFLIQPRP